MLKLAAIFPGLRCFRLRESAGRKVRMVLALLVGALLAGCSRDRAASDLCREKLEAQLKSPASAKYPKIEAKQDFLGASGGGAIYIVAGQVDAANSYGILLRSDFTCVVDFDNEKDLPSAQAFLGESSKTDQLRAARGLRDKYHRRQQENVRLVKQREKTRKPPDVISYDQFVKIAEGMSLEEVQEIIGDGTTAHPELFQVEPPKPEEYRPWTQYKWKNYDESYLLVYFESDKVVLLLDQGLW